MSLHVVLKQKSHSRFVINIFKYFLVLSLEMKKILELFCLKSNPKFIPRPAIIKGQPKERANFGWL